MVISGPKCNPTREFLTLLLSCLKVSSVVRRQDTVPKKEHACEKNHQAYDIQTITDLGQNLSLIFSLRSSRRK